MGYYSDFKVSANPEPEDFKDLLEEYSGYYFDNYGGGEYSLDESKWYDAHRDIEQLSRDYPDSEIDFQVISEDNVAERYTIKNGVITGRKKLDWVDA